MSDSIPPNRGNDAYPPLIGLIFIFNLIMGTGALTMPAAFADSGWILSSLIIFLICFISFISLSFIIECMSISNALKKCSDALQQNVDLDSFPQNGPLEDQRSRGNSNESNDVGLENTPLINHDKSPNGSLYREADIYDPFDITEKIELGQMAQMFFSSKGLNAFYVCIALYLYGDLAIYAAAISKSLRDVLCTYEDCSKTILEPSDRCWPEVINFDRAFAYRSLILTVTCILGPFTFFNVQKTKYLQIATILFRWMAFAIMITLSMIALIQGHAAGQPTKFRVLGIPSLFGICVYSFMCHHSLPSIITPVSNKKNLIQRIVGVYILALAVYYIASLTGVFTFPVIEDVYTLNFLPERCPITNSSKSIIVPQVKFFQYYLPLFPVFTLATSYPIIAITLTNNLRALLSKRFINFIPASSQVTFDKLMFPLLAIVPPMLVALVTENLEMLVGFVGSYAGAGIQYVIPAFLVMHARIKLQNFQEYRESSQLELNSESNTKTQKRFQSPFKHIFWVRFVLIWSAICILFVTLHHIMTWIYK